MRWPKTPTDEERAAAFTKLAELIKLYPVIKAREFCDRRDCTEGFYEVTLAELSKLCRDVYEQGKRDGKT